MFIVVGKGISSFVFLQHFFNALEARGEKQKIPLTLIHDPQTNPACSWTSTAMVFPYGIRAQDSEWSKTLIDAYEAFCRVHKNNYVPGVNSIDHWVIHAAEMADSSKFERRWKVKPRPIDPPIPHGAKLLGHQELGFHVEVQSFEKYVAQEIDKLIERYQVRVIEGSVKSVSANAVEMQNGEVFAMQGSFWGTSYGTGKIDWRGSEFSLLRLFLQHSRPVAGAYLLWNTCPAWAQKSFALDLDGDHLIFRPDLGCCLMGSTTQDQVWAPDVASLEQMYRRWQLWFANNCDVTLLPLQQAQIKVGMRLRGHKKRPWVGALSSQTPQHQGLLATYKNGYSLPYLLIPTIAQRCVELCR